MRVAHLRHATKPGIGLVEVIASIGIAVIVVTSLVSLAVFTLRSSLQSTLYLEGSKIANKQLELVRALRDQSGSWSTFVSSVSSCSAVNSCYMSDNITVSTGGAGTSGSGLSAVTFYFTATNSSGGLPNVNDSIVRVRANASWQVGANSISTNVYTDLTNWRGL